MNEVAFLLTVGEQAPFKDPKAIEDLTASQRDFWVTKVSDMYRKQREEMEKAKKRSK